MEQSAPNESGNDQQMQVEEIEEETSVLQELDQTQNTEENIDKDKEATTETRESTVHASTSKVNAIVTKDLIRGRPILFRKCKTKSKDLLVKLAKGFIPIAFELAPEGRRRKRSRRLLICEKRTVRSQRTLRRKYNSRPRCTRCDNSCRSSMKYY